MATKTLEAEPTVTKARAEANIKKEERAKDGAKAMMEYLANSRDVREQMAKLKALRLAQEQAETKKAETVKAETTKAAGKKPVPKKSGRKAVNG